MDLEMEMEAGEILAPWEVMDLETILITGCEAVVPTV